MRVARRHNVEDVELTRGNHLQAVREDAGIRIELVSFFPRSLRRRGDGNKLRVRILRDGLRMKLSPGAETGECKADRWHEKK